MYLQSTHALHYVHTYIHTRIHMQPEHSYVPHTKEFSNYCMVMWSPKATYFNFLKFLNTRGSASAMTPSSPISLQWISSHSRLSESRTQVSIVSYYYSTPIYHRLRDFYNFVKKLGSVKIFAVHLIHKIWLTVTVQTSTWSIPSYYNPYSG